MHTFGVTSRSTGSRPGNENHSDSSTKAVFRSSFHSVHLSQLLSVTETETLAAYMKPPSRYGGGGGAGGGDDSSGGPAKGFVVRDAPWNAAGNKVGCLSLMT